MGQSAKTRRSHRSISTIAPKLSIFPTACGWFGIAGGDQTVLAAFVGHGSELDVREAAQRWLGESAVAGQTLVESDWYPDLRHRLERYCSGVRVDFDDVRLDLPAGTDFQRRVLAATRKTGYGRTITYGELAERAGRPRAARAVGTVMSSNRFPVLIPCHRVVASGGRLGGYTSPQGPCLKERLLEIEREGVAAHTAKPAIAPERRKAKRMASANTR